MKNKCKHKNIHTELIKGKFGMVIGNIVFGKYFSHELPPVNSVINTYCADCGEKIKSVELNDYKK